MRKIKFRGYAVSREQMSYRTVYGGYYEDANGCYIVTHNEAVQVYPESVKQLVGKDKFGVDVYEGDLLKRGRDKPFAASMRHIDIVKDCELIKICER